ncbi:MAG TPA: hypothetical protein VGE67_04745 [Haloferula sp.]
MKRTVSNAIRAGVLVLLAVLTGRVEYHNRYHLDTWQQERFLTVRTLGIPIWRSKQHSGYLHYRNAYIRITGAQPDSDRWLVRRPDYVAVVMGLGGWRCGGMGYEVSERRMLLTALFDRFKEGMPRETAAALLKRIDDAVSARPDKRMNHDPEILDGLRVEVGLKPRFPEQTATMSDKPATETQIRPETFPSH